MFWFFGPEACGILAPWPGIQPAPFALEGKVFTTGPPGRSLPTVKNVNTDFPGGPMVRTPHFHYKGHRFDPWLGTQDPSSLMVRPTTNKTEMAQGSILGQGHLVSEVRLGRDNEGLAGARSSLPSGQPLKEGSPGRCLRRMWSVVWQAHLSTFLDPD